MSLKRIKGFPDRAFSDAHRQRGNATWVSEARRGASRTGIGKGVAHRYLSVWTVRRLLMFGLLLQYKTTREVPGRWIKGWNGMF